MGRATRVLIVDDEPAMREVLVARLERWGFQCTAVDTVAAAKAVVERFHPDVVISDLVMPDATGLDLLESLRQSDERRTILLITSYGTIDTAVKAIKGGAAHFLTKPLDYAALRAQLEAAPQIDEVATTVSLGAVRETPTEFAAAPAVGDGGMVGAHPSLVRMQDRIRAAARGDAPVFIVGESGTGKELVARTIVAQSPRRDRPFIVVNAAAIPEQLVESELFGSEKGAFTGADKARAGLFELAHTGTLFLDEITEMPMALQAKLLRTLEDGRIRRVGGRVEIPCNVRIIAATNRAPTLAVEQGRLRHDLHYRLDVVRVDVPPLRERASDIVLLARHFLADCVRRYGVATPVAIDDDAIAVLERHRWPGNIRELKNVVERAFVVAAPGSIGVAHLGLEPLSLGDRAASSLGADAPAHGMVIPHGLTLAEAERIVILETLKRVDGNKAEAARRLGLDVKTIRNKLKSFEGGAS
jgi:DNA-binding NtrC family response regulator